MSIPSDSNRNIFCPSQSFGTRMVMIPSVHRPGNVFPINCAQPNMNYQLNAPMPYRIIRYNSPAQYQQIMSAHGINLHGNENNTTVKSMKKSLLTEVVSKSSEDPLNLSSTNLNSFTSSKTSISPRENDTNNEDFVLKSPKKEPITPPSSQSEEKNQSEEEEQPEQIEKEKERNVVSVQQRKRKLFNDETLLRERELEGWVGHVKPVPGIPRQAGSKREEVLKAARSLFSKRTRTLYHWLYPSTSKNKLKATVAAAWDTLSTAEKDFYISQVLGRFGVPAGSLMVNPQLGGFKGLSGTPYDDVSWTSFPQAQTQEGTTRKRRRQRNNNGEGSSSASQIDEETLILKQLHEESLNDDFIDDPELSKEFEQFRWALHVSNTQEK